MAKKPRNTKLYFVFLMIILFVLAILVITIYLFRTNEFFDLSPPLMVIYDNTEFRGINLLGISSEDGVVHTQNIEECANLCAESCKCKGFSYFKPNGNCYLFGSGSVIPNNQGFAAGLKI